MSCSSRRCAVLLLAVFLASACARSPRDGEPAENVIDEAFVAEHKTRAEKLARQGRLPDALVHWRIVELLEPENPDVTEKRRAVETKILRQATTELEAARDAASRKDRQASRQALLRVLAVDPDNGEARDRLKAMELANIRRNRPKVARKQYDKTLVVTKPSDAPELEEAAKPKTVSEAPAQPSQAGLEGAAFQEAPLPDNTSEGADGAEMAALEPPADQEAEEARLGSLAPAIDLAKSGQHLDAIPQLKAHLIRFPKDEAALGLLADSHREIGIALYQGGKLRESVDHLKASESYAKTADPELEAALSDARGRLAQQAYEQGVRAFNSDLKQAIALWEETLEYDPAHVRARSYLDKAYKIQETLSEITTTE